MPSWNSEVNFVGVAQVVGALLAVGGIVAVAGAGYVNRDGIKDLLQWFISVVDDFGPGAPFVYTCAVTLVPSLLALSLGSKTRPDFELHEMLAPALLAITASDTACQAARASSLIPWRFDSGDHRLRVCIEGWTFEAFQKAFVK